MLRNVESKQTNTPQNHQNNHGEQQDFGMAQKRKGYCRYQLPKNKNKSKDKELTVVTQERDNKVERERDEIERIPQEDRDPAHVSDSENHTLSAA